MDTFETDVPKTQKLQRFVWFRSIDNVLLISTDGNEEHEGFMKE